MKRRDLLRLAGGAIACGAAASIAQRAKPARVGALYIGPADADSFRKGLREGLRDLGHVEGRDIQFEFRSAEDDPARLPALAAELVRMKVDVIVALYVQSALAAKEATREIPIVIMASDPLKTGIVTKAADPLRNITGVSLMSGAVGKSVDLFRDLSSSIRRVGVLAHAGHPTYAKIFVQEIQRIAAAIGMEVPPVAMVRGPADFQGAFKTLVADRVQAVVVQGSAAVKPVAELAIRHRLPTVSTARAFPDAGGFMSFGAEASTYRLAARFVHNILQGRKPAEMPIEEPTKFELVLNLATAKAIGITVPESLLLRADILMR